MNYVVENFIVDLGETPIENMFLNQYLQIADGNSIKLYLFLYKYAKDPTFKGELDDEYIGKSIGLTVEEVKQSREFWLGQGILKLEKNIATGSETYSFLSLRQLYYGLTEPYVKEEKKVINNNSIEIRTMFDRIESIIQLELTSNECERILEHIQELNQELPLVSYAFEYCDKEMNKRNVNYVLGVLRNWHIDGISTLPQLEEELEKKKSKKSNIARKRKYHKNQENITNDKRISDDEIENLVRKRKLADLGKKGEI